ncbi:hypothetical protein VTH82DRAFT_3913 [Thermothelomyces myriococcoides]
MAAPGQPDDAYATALSRLAQLQSNRAVTSLFNPAPASGGGGSKQQQPSGSADLNAVAIQEMNTWLRRAGYSQASLARSPVRFVHVAGTKGKGSVSAMIASVLAQYPDAAGRVGLYTSPHVLSVRERIALDGDDGAGLCRPIDPARFARYVGEVWDRLTDVARREAIEAKLNTTAGGGGAGGGGGGGGSGSGSGSGSGDANNSLLTAAEEEMLSGPATKPFYFRFLTLVALHAFVSEAEANSNNNNNEKGKGQEGDKRPLRSAVIECGIGGEYDSTNLLPPDNVTATVVTQLGIDHVAMLGDTVDKIAWHKAGIFRKGVKGFTRRLPSPDGDAVMKVLRRRAKEKGAILVEIPDEEVDRWAGVDGARLKGPFQKHNMALAVYAAREHLLRAGVRFEGRFGSDDWSLADIPPEFVRGLREASLRGRCEILRKEDIEWHVDGAHTDDSLAGVGKWFAEEDEDAGSSSSSVRVLLFNQQERDPAPLLKALLSGVQSGGGGRGDQAAFDYAIFTRNEEREPADGEERDLFAQIKAHETMLAVDGRTSTTVYNAVRPAVEQIKNIASQAKEQGKRCRVLVTGSFHLVGPVLKIIDHVES